MKLNKIILSAIVGSALLSVSCTDQLNFHEYNDYDEDYVKLNFANVGGLVSGIYDDLDNDFGNYGGAVLGSASDESQYAYNSSSIYDFYNGSWSPVNAMSSMWTKCYKGIASCNLYLSKYVGLTFPDLVDNEDYQKQMFRYNNYQYEVRFLRAYFYFNLVRQYGAVPLMGDAIPNGEIANSVKRTDAQTVFTYIINQCDSIQNKIVKDYTDIGDMSMGKSETGRANKLTVMALKARAALYAASPLFNTDNNVKLWQRAAEANKEVLDEASAEGKALASDYASLFGPQNYQDADALKELIFMARDTRMSNSYESYNFPFGLPDNRGGQGGNCPTQNLVDAYEMQATGEPYKGDYNKDSDPYAGRDPRFTATIVKNGDKWPSLNTTPLELFDGGVNTPTSNGGVFTGYYLRKYSNAAQDLSPKKNTTSYHSWVTFRLAEFYLNYAEAVFRLTGSPYTIPSGFTMSAVEAIDKIRERAKMPDFPAGLSNERFWEKYKNERMVELAFEGHRFWDVRRWKEADKYFKSITEMHITKDASGKLNYERKEIPRQWDDKMYFFPIPQTELLKNKNLTQNLGW